MEEIQLNAPSLQGRIFIGNGALSRISSLTQGQKNFVVTDDNVYSLYSDFFKKYFLGAEIFILSAGEKSKSFETLGDILEKMTGAGLRRTSKVFAVGGGVVGDIAGLAAALYMRGVSYIQIPTTLLAQTDSGVGGKTAVNLCGVKNVVGAFYQPSEVLIDPAFLQTLPARELKCGLGEIVKYAALDPTIFRALSDAKGETVFSNLSFLSSLIPLCVHRKAKVVEADEREQGERACLNIGHTTGHVVEMTTSLSHGESVLWGMFFETNLAIQYGVCEKAYGEELLKIVRLALHTPPVGKIDFADIGSQAEMAHADKKNVDDEKIYMSVPKSVGGWTRFSLPFAEYQSALIELAKSALDFLKIENDGGRYENN